MHRHELAATMYEVSQFECDPTLLRAIAETAMPRVPATTEILAGLELGGIPVATAIGMLTGLPVVFVRKAAKEYGTQRLAEGADIEGRNVLVIEDVVTSGGQIVTSTADLRALGAQIDTAMCVVDREEGGTQNLASVGLSLIPLFTASELRRAADSTSTTLRSPGDLAWSRSYSDPFTSHRYRDPEQAVPLSMLGFRDDNRPMGVRRVLVVGAGIAGSTLACWLARHGFETTVVERSAGQRSRGSPVDVRGPALAVVEQMNLLAPLREAATAVTTLAVVDGRGRRIGAIPTQAGDGLDLPRSDLAAILAGAARADVEFRYDDTVVALHDDGRGVDVTFERAAPRRFDLVVGADGLHSRVRRLAFGPESRFVTHLGLYIATVMLDGLAADRHTVVLHNAPGRAVAVHPTTGREGVAFIFRHPQLPGLDDREHQKQVVAEAYAGMRWRVPELLERVRGCDDLYFDSVSRVRLDAWSRGRTVLVGDAAGCVSLFGEGSSMAIAGAVTLVQALVAQPGAPEEALARYQRVHRKRITRRQRGVAATSHLLVPATRTGLAVRDAVISIRGLATHTTPTPPWPGSSSG